MKKPHPLVYQLIVVYSLKHDAYSVLSHNLLREDAASVLEECRAKKLPAFALSQSGYHSTTDPDKCAKCNRRVAFIKKGGRK